MLSGVSTRERCRAPLCPAFAFGQTDCFHYWRPGPPVISRSLVKTISRKIGFAPLLLWGWWGTPLPVGNPVTLVIGDPIKLPKIESPSDEECQKYLTQFISDLKDLFYKHRADAGYPDQDLLIL
jgi:diacylglycerol O-acyltransferase 2, plant